VGHLSNSFDLVSQTHGILDHYNSLSYNGLTSRERGGIGRHNGLMKIELHLGNLMNVTPQIR